MWKASYDSTSFSFEAYGNTQEEARESLVLGLLRHGKQYGISAEWFNIEDIVFLQVTAGAFFRDGEEMK